MEIITETKQSEDALLRRIEETKKKLLEKELDNSSLRKQVTFFTKILTIKTDQNGGKGLISL